MERIQNNNNDQSWRVFQGYETRLSDGVTRVPAIPEAWYVEPEDYEGDVLFSCGYLSREEALNAIEYYSQDF